MAIQISQSLWQLKYSNLNWLDYIQFYYSESSTKYANQRSLWATGHNIMQHNLRASVSLIDFRVEVTNWASDIFVWATKWSFVCLFNLKFLPRFKTVVPEEYSFHKVAPQDYRTVPLSCVPPACAFEFQVLETKCFVLAFKGAQHMWANSLVQLLQLLKGVSKYRLIMG